jgi:hypothetical protein
VKIAFQTSKQQARYTIGKLSVSAFTIHQKIHTPPCASKVTVLACLTIFDHFLTTTELKGRVPDLHWD